MRIFALAGPLAIFLSPLAALADEVSYSRDVRPILQRSCVACHQPAMKSNGLDLTTFEAFRTGGKKGPSFVANDAARSTVIQYLTGEAKPIMPMGQPPLPPEQIAILRNWIAAGAKDDSPAIETRKGPPVYRQAPVITALRFSPDGKSIAISGNGEVLIHDWQAARGTPAARLAGKSERILSIAYSADGKMLVAAGGTPARFGEIQWWDVATGKQLRAAELTADTVFGASLAPDGSKVAVGCADNTVHVFDSASAKELYKLGNHENWVLATVFGKDGKRLVSVGRDRAAKLIDAEAGQFLENVNALSTELSAIARHPSKDIVAIGGEDRYPYVYMLDRPRNMKVGDDATLIRKMDRQEGAIFALDWSPDGKWIAVAGASPKVNLYDADTGSHAGSCTGHAAGIYALAFSPDSRTLAAGGFDGKVRFYDPQDCAVKREFIPVPIEAGTEGAQ
jgi:Tol biopolymer transport system component/mono/diheme cytochrome c family protein